MNDATVDVSDDRFEFRKITNVTSHEQYAEILKAIGIIAMDGGCTGFFDSDGMIEDIADFDNWWILHFDGYPCATGYGYDEGFNFYSTPWFRVNYSVDQRMLAHLEEIQIQRGFKVTCQTGDLNAAKCRREAEKVSLLKAFGYECVHNHMSEAEKEVACDDYSKVLTPA